MNTLHCLTRIRFALILLQIHFTLDGKFHFGGIYIVMRECDLKYPAEIEQKIGNFHLSPYQMEANPFFRDCVNFVKQPN